MKTLGPGRAAMRFVLGTALLLLLAAAPASAAAPALVNYQGVLRDDTGAALAGPVSIDIALYDVATGGSAHYLERHTGVTLDNGVFQIEIGSGLPLSGSFDTSLFQSPAFYIEVSVNGGLPLTPRQRMSSVPYAFEADHAQSASSATTAQDSQTLQGHPSSDFQSAISASCAPGTSVSAIDAIGTVTCNSTDTRLTEGEVDAFVANNGYAQSGHAHDASEIASGTLDPARYDAYADLGAAGRLDDNLGSDILTRDQADTRYMQPGSDIAVGSITARGDISALSLTLSAPIRRYYSVSGYELQSQHLVRTSGSGEVQLTSGAPADVDAFAGVHLPHGATITHLACNYLDNLSDAHIWVQLRRNGSDGDVLIAEGGTTDGATGLGGFSVSGPNISNALVDDLVHAYYLVVSFHAPTPGTRDLLTMNYCAVYYDAASPLP